MSSSVVHNDATKQSDGETDSEVCNDKAAKDETDGAAWTAKPARYTAAIGSYCEWNTDVDLLSPSPSNKPPPPEDRFVDYYYNVLQYILHETGFPETMDETDAPSSGGKGRPSEYGGDTGVTIAVLSNPIEIIGLLLEGGRQCPGDLLLVLSMTWVEKRKQTPSDVGYDEELYRLYVHKAIAFMQNGRSALRVYNPPRRVTYCVNFFTPACTGAMRSDGAGLEDDLDCTMVGAKLVSLVDDKLWTRMRASEVGVNVPETLAFAYRSPINYDCARTDHVVRVVRLESTTDSAVRSMISSAVQAVVSSPMMSLRERVVVKPSGPMWMASMGVSFHDRSDINSIVAACMGLLKDLQPGDSILVETFYQTLKPRFVLEPPRNAPGVVSNGMEQPTASQLAWAATDQSACRFRATVCRGLDDRPHMTKLVCGTACNKQPVNGDNTIGQSLDSTLISFGLVDPVQRAKIYEQVRVSAEKVLSAIIRHEKTMSIEERGFAGAQTDLIGIDYILSDVSSSSTTSGALFPVAIEVNSVNCTCNCDLYEFMYRETSGEALQPFFEHAIGASQRRQLKGRTVVVFGGDVDFVSKNAHDYRLRIVHVLTGSNQNSTSNSQQLLSPYYSSATIHQNLSEGVESHAKRILTAIHQRLLPGRAIDGCLSLDPHQVPLASAVGSMLGLSQSCLTDVNGSRTAADIRMTQKMLSTRNAAIPQWPPSYLYSMLHDHAGALPASKSLLDLLGLGETGNGVAFPRYEQLIPFVKQVHRVSVVIWRRRLLGGFVFDFVSGANCDKCKIQNANKHTANGDSHTIRNGYVPSALNGFNADSSHQNGWSQKNWKDEILGMRDSECNSRGIKTARDDGYFHWPSVLPDDKRDQLIIAAYQCVNELDLVSGLFTVDMTFNAVSPKLLRVVPCLDAASSEVNLLRSTSGVDLFVYAALIACDLKPILPVDSSFQNHLRARRPNFGHRAFDIPSLSCLIHTDF